MNLELCNPKIFGQSDFYFMENQEEIWRAVVGYEGLYEVSNLGNVRSLPKHRYNRSGTWIHNGRILSPGIKGDGYLSVVLCHNGKNRTISVHQLVARSFLENPLGLMEVNHIDGVKDNNSVDNLEWCTRTENLKHAFRIGLKNQFGDRHHRRKLSSEQVLEIRKLYPKRTGTRAEFAKAYNISEATIKSIISNRNWSTIV